ncbi:MAG: phosphodiester glycosidase family protein [Proteobacteria bacterium]|nr:phosphodiester glycosidase family protein [Pseudomonadota bacterium]
MHWLHLLEAAVDDDGLPANLLAVLRAFPSVTDPIADHPSLAALDRAVASLPVADRLIEEVDRAQAAMFERRMKAVLELDGDARWQLLKRGLRCRVAGILASPGPRAARIRAIIDFYFAQAAVLRWADPSHPQPADLPATWRDVAPGVRHGRIDGRSAWGPVHLNLLSATDVRIETGNFSGRDFAEAVRETGACAGVSGGFFLYSEPDIEPPSHRGDPVGLLVHDGEVLNPPWLRRSALVQDRDGRVRIEAIEAPGPRWTRAHGTHSPEDAGPVAAMIGTQVVARGVGRLAIPLAGAVVPCRPNEDPGWHPGSIVNAVAGGPMLLHPTEPVLDLAAEDFAGTAPPVTFSQDETFDQNLLPRMGVGIREDGSLLFCAVDGRHFERAPGMTLRQLGEVLRAHGCVYAMNLDGGSSKRMVVQGRVVDLPSTEVQSGGRSGPVRPVHSGILIHAGHGRAHT